MYESYIKVYLTKDIIGWIIGRGGWRIKSISKDTNTIIRFNKRDYDSYFSIEGSLENTHRARIILQDLEKQFYKNIFMEEVEKEEMCMQDTIERMKMFINKLEKESSYLDY